jgi:hypothetical protein
VKASRRLSLLLLAFLVVLLAPLGAAAKPPERQAPLAPLPSLLTPLPQVAGAHLVVMRLTSAPAGARPGHAYLLHGSIVNTGGAGVRSRIVVHLLRVGSRPLTIGGTLVALAAHRSGVYGVRIRLPRVLPHGSYALVACARFRCVTAERHLQVGPAAHPRPVRLTAGASKTCSSGAHSLSSFGDHVYPETGNGGYTSVHTDVFLAYDAATNLFLPGTHVVLADQATQCLTDFSLDFERTSANTKEGPNMTVDSVLVNGRPAS